MFGLNLIPWAIAAALALGGFAYIINCEQIKKEQAAFVERLENETARQKERNDQQAKQYQQYKEKADADTKQRLDNLHRTIARLRDQARTNPSLVPATASCAGSADTAAFDRTELDGALRRFTEGVSGLIVEGESAVIQLDGAKGWALKLTTTLSQ